MLKKFMLAVMALMTVFGAAISTAPQADAGRGRGVGLGIAAGIIGLGVLGAYANARDRDRGYDYVEDRRCYRGPRECFWTERRCFENRYGEEICRGGRRVCESRTICD